MPVSRKRTLSTLSAFIIVGFIVYSNTFDVPFHFDDQHVVSDLSLEDMLEKCEWGGSRVVAHITFLINYWLGGTSVLGYHIFNTFVHIGTAYFVYMFLYQILSLANRLERFEQLERLNRLNNRYAAPKKHGVAGVLAMSDPIFWPALLGGMLFLVHPLATQAVTYITQRYTSLAGFFYIGSLVFFVFARITLEQGQRFLKASHLVPYASSFAMAVLAMRTKEMAITLPAALVLTEYSFMKPDFGTAIRRILYLLPILSTALIIPVSNIIGVETMDLESVAAMQDYTWAPQFGRMEYLLTQFKVIVGIYLKLVFWPVGQNIDHDYVISKTLLDLPTISSFLALAILAGIGLWLFQRARLVSFGILWFFVTISPTSSIVPNNEFVAEHRAYISLMGLAFAVAGLPAWQSRWKSYLGVMMPILLLLTGLTYTRNKVWRSGLTLWKDSVSKSGNLARPHNNLAVALADQGMLDEAISEYSQALEIKPNFAEAHYDLGNALIKQGSLNEAVNHYSAAVQIRPDFAQAHSNLGSALYRQGKTLEAMEHYSRALQIKPNFAAAQYNMGIALADQGRLKEAIEHYSEALHIEPGHVNAHYSLAAALAGMGRIEEAIDHYYHTLRLKPDYAEAHVNLGNALCNQGKIDDAISHYSQALKITPGFALTHYNLANALFYKGRHQEAASHFSKALQIEPEFAEARHGLALALRQLDELSEASKKE